MKIKGLILIGFLTILMSGCSGKTDDFYFEFSEFDECQENAIDDIEIESLVFPEKIDNGYLYSYVFGFGHYEFIFHNPDYVYERDEFVTKSVYGNILNIEEGTFRKTEIPEGYYLSEVIYINTSICVDSTHAEEISLNLDQSFIYYSKNEYSESEFRETHSEVFE